MDSKVLFVWFKQPDAIPDGGNQANLRSFQTIKKIFGPENVDSIYVHTQNERTSLVKKISTIWYFLFDYHNGITPGFVKHVVNMANNYNYIFLSTSLFGIIAKALKDRCYKGTIITHFHNVESEYYEASVPKWLPGRNIIVRGAAHNDQYACTYSNRFCVLNKRDGDRLEQLYHRKADIIIPIALKDHFRPIDESVLTSGQPLCTFIGSNFAPNREGILWFANHVLPFVDIRFKIVGKDMSKLKDKYTEMQNVEIVSDVPDLAPYFEEADFMILPIFAGSGMKVKTCESMMFGKNILGTDETFEGYDVDFDKVGAKCNTSDEYISKIQSYIAHPIPRFNKYSREVYLKKYSDDASEQVFRKLFKV